MSENVGKIFVPPCIGWCREW